MPITLVEDLDSSYPNGAHFAKLEQEHLVAMLNRKVDYRTTEAEANGLFEVLWACGVQPDWMADARHFNWNPIEDGKPRPRVVFPESLGLPRV